MRRATLAVILSWGLLAGCDTELQPLPTADTEVDTSSGEDAMMGDTAADVPAMPDTTTSGDIAADTAAMDVGDTVDLTDPNDLTDAIDAVDTSMDTADTAMDTADMTSMWGTCEVSGQPGECVHVDDCDGGRVTTPNLCPGPAEIRCCHEPVQASMCDPNERVVPPENQTLVEGAGDVGCPDGMAAVDGTFCIDRYEAVLVEILTDGTEVPHSPFFPPEGRRVRAMSVEGVVPQGYITGNQAAGACAEAGKRLCTDTEWLRACQGSAMHTYPYGDTRQPGVCNDARSPHPVVQYFGTSESWIWNELGNACIGQQDDTVALTGAHTGCISETGALDMMGNLHEWTADPEGTFRGGFYTDTVVNGEGCLYRTTAHSTGHWDYSTGFRCCTDPISP